MAHKKIKFSESTQALFEENEWKANNLIAGSFGILAFIYLVIAICSITGVFDVPATWGIFFFGLQTALFIAMMFAIRRLNQKKFTKYVGLVALLLAISLYTVIYSYGVELLFAIPIVLSCRYYLKKVTLNVSIVTTIAYIVSKFLSSIYGLPDINMVSFVPGTIITITSTMDAAIADAISQLQGEALHQFLVDYNINNFFYCIDSNLVFLLAIIYVCYNTTKRMQTMVLIQADISSKKAAVESELKMGNSIQISMLPHNFPSSESVEIFATMDPAKEVGGDFYDFFFIDKTHVGIVVADVSGKGVPAALFMVITKTLIKDQAKLGLSPEKVFTKVNHSLSKSDDEGMFVTAWFGVLDMETGVLNYSNAGHNPPLICIGGKDFQFLRSPKRKLPLAAMDKVEYYQESITLSAGDSIFLYTDGVTEACHQKDFYGETRLTEYLNKNRDTDLEGVLHGLKAELDAFADGEPQYDDITMLMMKYKGRG
ncbi:MAG: PP2C family protein-serine/threonine phosphatase [Fibrobacter sp.]|nr:PP2C family protein-serine/threonine phosphatase [Fibrobacter sp.]